MTLVYQTSVAKFRKTFRNLELHGVMKADAAAADEPPEVRVEAVAPEMEDVLRAVIATRELQEDRREAYWSCRRHDRESCPRIAGTNSGAAGGRLLGSY